MCKIFLQIIMCSVYAICKVCERELLFKNIVAMYKNLPHATAQVIELSYDLFHIRTV